MRFRNKLFPDNHRSTHFGDFAAFVMLDYFALFVLIVTTIALLGGFVLLGYLPGRIARDRNHPQADAVSVCGWVGVLTLGLLLPVAYVWAYWRYPKTNELQEATR